MLKRGIYKRTVLLLALLWTFVSSPFLIQVSEHVGLELRRVQVVWTSPEGVIYGSARASVGADETEIHWMIFDPAEGIVQMVLHVEEEITSGKYRTHTVDFSLNSFQLDNVVSGETLSGSGAAIDLRIAPDEHIVRFESKTGQQVVGLTGAGNIGWNDWFLAYAEGELICSEEEIERVSERVYSSLVVYKDGSVTMRNLSYDSIGEDVRIIDQEQDIDITEDVEYAFFGQRLIWEGEIVDVVDHYEQFSDLRQVLKSAIIFPMDDIWGGGMYLGFDQMFEKEGMFIQKALNGEVIEIDLLVKYDGLDLNVVQIESLRKSLSDRGYLEQSSIDNVSNPGDFFLTPNQIRIQLKHETVRDALSQTKEVNGVVLEMGYREVVDASSVKEPGDFIVADDTLTIKFLEGVYPHHIEAVTESGRVVSIVVSGSSGWCGGTVKGITEWIAQMPEFKNDPITHAIVIDNGADAMLWLGGDFLARPNSLRGGNVQAAILLIRE
ncbi:MAG: hypothetical protein P9X27_06775 [Candidatus Kaelpia aquatica]|nr:hypothetical protein [Candidatus Kaelpia aquatica]